MGCSCAERTYYDSYDDDFDYGYDSYLYDDDYGFDDLDTYDYDYADEGIE